MSNQPNKGGRPRKQQISWSPESLQRLLQNIYNEADEQRIKAIYQYNKQNRNVRDNDDIAAIGKTNTELLKVVDGSLEKKLQIARLMQQVIYKDAPGLNSNNGSVQTTAGISDDEKDAIFETIRQEMDKENIEFYKEENKKITKEVKDDNLPF